jgi:hypothetical protein
MEASRMNYAEFVTTAIEAGFTEKQADFMWAYVAPRKYVYNVAQGKSYLILAESYAS